MMGYLDGSVFFKKSRDKKREKSFEISRFFRRLACRMAVFLVRINFERTTWGITTKPMHTALFFKIEPGYFVFGQTSPLVKQGLASDRDLPGLQSHADKRAYVF